MERKSELDTFGVVSLIGFSLLLAFNQVVIKVANEGLQPIFLAALRSFGAAICLYLWMRLRRFPFEVPKGTVGPGLLMGVMFAAEFICLFLALDLTTVARVSVLFYTMPVWLALGAHFLIPGERLTVVKSLGLVCAVAGVAWAVFSRDGEGGTASLAGDLLALAGSLGWAGIALCARTTALREMRPEVQLLWQLIISAPILFLAAFAFGPFLRDPTWLHWSGLAFQILAIATAGFLFWFWLLSIYPAASVASFSFLAPIFGVGLGWALLGDPVGPEVIGSLVLVCLGLVLINRPAKDRPKPADGQTPAPPDPDAEPPRR